MIRGLKIISGEPRGHFYELTLGEYTIGRDDSAKIKLNSQAVSRHHATLSVKNEQIAISDAGSANGITVNQRVVTQAVLKAGDQVGIGDFILEWIDDQPAKINAVNKETLVGKLLKHPLSKRWLEKTAWTTQLLVILLLTISLDHLLIANIFRQRILADTTQSSLLTAQAIVLSLAERNKQDLAQGRETLLNIDSVLNQPGVIAAFITDLNGKVLAPPAKLNQQLTDATTTQALKSNKADVLTSDELAGGIFRLATPIRHYLAEQATYRTVGAAVLLYMPEQVVKTLAASERLYFLSLLLAIMAGLAIFYLIRTTTLIPIKQVVERIGQLFRGEIERVPREVNIVELMPLIDSANSLQARMNQTELSNSTSDAKSTQAKLSHDFFSQIAPLKWMLTKLSEAVLIIGENGTIIALNQRARQLLEIESTNGSASMSMKVITNELYRNFLEDGWRVMLKSKKTTLTKVLECKDFAYQFIFHSYSQEAGLPAVMVIIEKL